jgi:hypothetical protein
MLGIDTESVIRLVLLLWSRRRVVISLMTAEVRVSPGAGAFSPGSSLVAAQRVAGGDLH